MAEASVLIVCFPMVFLPHVQPRSPVETGALPGEGMTTMRGIVDTPYSPPDYYTDDDGYKLR